MKLLKEYYDLSDAEHIARKLESKGILTFISCKNSSRLTTRFKGALKVGLWIVLNNQYLDAVAYLNDRNHIIETALTPDDISNLKKQSKLTTFNSFNKFIVYSSIIILLLFIGLFFTID